MDVATAARLCDGAIVVVDAVEGVCIQTHAVLRTAWSEGVRPLLLINKVDRLACELQLSAEDAYGHCCRILEQANAILSNLYMADLVAGQSAGGGGGGGGGAGAGAGGGAEGEASGVDVDERAEAALFFDPRRGNVVFASAVDGWAFTLDEFAALHAPRLGLPRGALRRALWGEACLHPRSRALVRLADAPPGARPLAVTHVWERLWAVYESILTAPDATREAKILAALALPESALSKRDLACKDPRGRLQVRGGGRR